MQTNTTDSTTTTTTLTTNTTSNTVERRVSTEGRRTPMNAVIGGVMAVLLMILIIVIIIIIVMRRKQTNEHVNSGDGGKPTEMKDVSLTSSVNATTTRDPIYGLFVCFVCLVWFVSIRVICIRLSTTIVGQTTFTDV
jgi:hypothetical protein